MHRKSLAVALILATNCANSTDVESQLPPDAYREGHELDLDQV